MSDNLTIFGNVYEGVNTLTFTDTNNQSKVYINTADANATAEDIASGKTAYVQGNKVTGTGSGGGDHSVEDAIIDRTISGVYENSRITSIGRYAFAYCPNLTTVNFSACKDIGACAFYSCASLTTVSFPACKSMGTSAFAYCTSLTTANFPVCENIGISAFYSCTSLTTANFPACKSIGTSAFIYCSSLTTASFPSCKSIGTSAFYRCYAFISLYLLGSSMANLANSNAFSSTPFVGYVSSTSGVLGSIYVPASLLESYKAANNWSFFADRFVSVE